VGIPDRRTALRRKLEERSEDLLETAINQAMQGDAGLMKALLGRVIPPQRPETPPTEFYLPSGNLSQRAEAVVNAVIAGEINPSTGNELLAAMTQSIKIQEFQDLTDRVAALEVLYKK
jgi:hypothetical protein